MPDLALEAGAEVRDRRKIRCGRVTEGRLLRAGLAAGRQTNQPKAAVPWIGRWHRVGRAMVVGNGHCPRCFARISGGAPVCPVCGADRQDLHAHDYRDKPLDALGHPRNDGRMRAIIALGMRHEPGIVARRAACAHAHPLDGNAGRGRPYVRTLDEDAPKTGAPLRGLAAGTRHTPFVRPRAMRRRCANVKGRVRGVAGQADKAALVSAPPMGLGRIGAGRARAGRGAGK